MKVEAMVEAVTKAPRVDKYDGQAYTGAKIGDKWYNFKPNNAPKKGQVIAFEAPAKGNKVDSFSVVDGSASGGQVSGNASTKAAIPAGQVGVIKGMILNNAVQLVISQYNAGKIDGFTAEEIFKAAKVVAQACNLVDTIEITA